MLIMYIVHVRTILTFGQLIDQLRKLGQAATLTPEIRRYLQDVVVFMRLERGVDGGITAYSDVCFVELAKYGSSTLQKGCTDTV